MKKCKYVLAAQSWLFHFVFRTRSFSLYIPAHHITDTADTTGHQTDDTIISTSSATRYYTTYNIEQRYRCITKLVMIISYRPRPITSEGFDFNEMACNIYFYFSFNKSSLSIKVNSLAVIYLFVSLQLALYTSYKRHQVNIWSHPLRVHSLAVTQSALLEGLYQQQVRGCYQSALSPLTVVSCGQTIQAVYMHVNMKTMHGCIT